MGYRNEVVLVTGGSGFLGSNVVDELVAAGRFQACATTRRSTQYCNPQAQYIAIDITQHDEIAAIIERIKPIAILHTITPGPFAPASLHDRDHAATMNLVEIAQDSVSVRAFVYISSAEAMFNVSGEREQHLSETEAILHRWESAPSAYARTKSGSDPFALRANGPRLATAVLRLPGMFGPRENKKTGIACSFIRVANTHITRIQLGDNSVRHEWIYVKNAAHAHVLAINALLNSRKGADGEVFLTTDGTPIKLWDFVRKIWIAAGDKGCTRRKKIIILWWIMFVLAATTEWVFHIFTMGRLSPPLTALYIHFMRKGAWFDISSTCRRLDYRYDPLSSTDKGIEETVAWYRQTSSVQKMQ